MLPESGTGISSSPSPKRPRKRRWIEIARSYSHAQAQQALTECQARDMVSVRPRSRPARVTGAVSFMLVCGGILVGTFLFVPIWMLVFSYGMYADMYVCMHVCMYAYMYSSMYMCMYVCTHVYMYVRMYAHSRVLAITRYQCFSIGAGSVQLHPQETRVFELDSVFTMGVLLTDSEDSINMYYIAEQPKMSPQARPFIYIYTHKHVWM
jgi:hypothetical protein